MQKIAHYSVIVVIEQKKMKRNFAAIEEKANSSSNQQQQQQSECAKLQVLDCGAAVVKIASANALQLKLILIYWVMVRIL